MPVSIPTVEPSAEDRRIVPFVGGCRLAIISYFNVHLDRFGAGLKPHDL